MNRLGMDARMTSLGALCVVLVCAGGCGKFRVGMGFSRNSGDERVAEAPPQVQPQRIQAVDVDPKNEAASKEEVLDAVQAFLRRTEDFDSESAATAPVKADPRPAPQAVVTAKEPNPQEVKSVRTVDYGDQEATRMATVANNRIAVAPAPPSPQRAIPVIRSVSVVKNTGSSGRSKPESPPVVRTANKPLAAAVNAEELSIDKILKDLAAKKGSSSDVSNAWQLMLATLAFERDDEFARSRKSLPHAARQVMDSVSQVVAETRRLTRNPALSSDDALKKADELSRVLGEQADPQVSTVALCREVVTFGVYEELDPEILSAGQTTQAIVYIEVDNFNSEPAGDGKFRTVLATRLELLTGSGDSVWQREEPEIVDQCRRRRQDFFIAQRITLPPTLAAGEYVLKVLVEDKLSGRANEANLNLSIGIKEPVVLGR